MKTEEKIYPLINAHYVGIKCDNPACDFYDESVMADQYESYIDKPCPKCGCNLMTRECYEQSIKNLEQVEKLNLQLNHIFPEWLKKRMMKKQEGLKFGVNKDGTIDYSDMKELDRYGGLTE